MWRFIASVLLIPFIDAGVVMGAVLFIYTPLIGISKPKRRDNRIVIGLKAYGTSMGRIAFTYFSGFDDRFFIGMGRFITSKMGVSLINAGVVMSPLLLVDAPLSRVMMGKSGNVFRSIGIIADAAMKNGVPLSRVSGINFLMDEFVRCIINFLIASVANLPVMGLVIRIHFGDDMGMGGALLGGFAQRGGARVIRRTGIDWTRGIIA